MIDVAIITGSREINSAKQLIYQDYWCGKSWDPGAGNLSGLRIDHEQRIYTDPYDQTATWFGAYISGEIIGCCRLCKRLDGIFEIEPYLEKQGRSLPDDIRLEPQASEFNRFATHEKFRGSPMVFVTLTGLVTKYSLSSKIHIFSTTGYNSVTRYKKIGFKCCDFEPFKFNESDLHKVHLVYSTDSEKRKQNIVNRCASIAESYLRKAPKGYYDTL
jgi:hypothetical protein